MKSTSNAVRDRLTWPRRIALALAGVLGIALLVTARSLEPDPRGFGTHEQLGLTPCYFHELTGYVCPMCGATTSWAYLLRGQPMRAALANLGGMVFAVGVAIGATWLLFVAVWGRWTIVQPKPKPILLIASAWLAVVVLDWLRRIYLGSI